MVNPDPYRGRYGGANCRDSVVQTTRKCDCLDKQCSAGDEYFKELLETFKHSVPENAVAGMFAESIQGVGGTIQFPKGYIKRAADLVRANGGIFISDEVGAIMLSSLDPKTKRCMHFQIGTKWIRQNWQSLLGFPGTRNYSGRCHYGQRLT